MKRTRNYLRVRGEYALDYLHGLLRTELPPRARRIRGYRLSHFLAFGTTSACAENTISRAGILLMVGNYLRVRGEYYLHAGVCFGGAELPPRARRIHAIEVDNHYYSGTTSACAENTEKMVLKQLKHEELPPRARRIPKLVFWVRDCWGTTSACAENTGDSYVEHRHHRNYLRVRGEYYAYRHLWTIL